MMADKTVLLAGASGSIGNDLVPMFSKDTLVLHSHKHDPTCEGEFHTKADINNYEDVDRMVSAILEEFGRIDVLVNVTGVSIDSFAHKADPEVWKSVIETNLNGSFNLVRAVLPSMRENNYGRIILISSVVHQHPVLGTSAYSASKAGLIGLTRTVALENAIKGVTCNSIALGYAETGMAQRIREDVREKIREEIPMKRFMRVDELHRTIEYLIDTEYITGQTLNLNGGLYM